MPVGPATAATDAADVAAAAALVLADAEAAATAAAAAPPAKPVIALSVSSEFPEFVASSSGEHFLASLVGSTLTQEVVKTPVDVVIALDISG